MANTSLVSPISDRIARIRARFKDIEFHDIVCDAERTKILTDSYIANEADYPLIKKAKFFFDLCEKMTVLVEDEELIVGNQGRTYRAISPYVDWYEKRLFDVVCGDDETFRLVFQTPGCRNKMSDEDREIFRSAADFWSTRSIGAKLTAAMPDKVQELYKSSALDFGDMRMGGKDITAKAIVGLRPQGHFCANFDKIVHKGIKAIKEEALAHMAALEGSCFGGDGEKYLFYKSILIVCDGMCLLAKRYAAKCLEQSKTAAEPRKSELLSMGNSLNYIIENPCRTYWEAMQAINFYMLCMCMDGQNHGITFGRLDQYAGHFLEEELKKGEITPQFAQEIADSFILKAAEYTRATTDPVPQVITNPDGTVSYKHAGFTMESGQHFSVGGIKKDGTDATNTLSHLLVQCYARLYTHSPSLSVRVHKTLPESLWKIAIEASTRAGGMPTFENDDIIIPALLKKGYTLEDARDYCLIGCVEPSGTGNEWPCCGTTGKESFWNYGAAVVLALNNGINPLNGYQGGPATGYLYEMETFEQFKDALVKQAHFYLGWHVTCANIAEYAIRNVYPCPVASSTIDGCLEKGQDVTYGGAKYNSTGVTCCGIGNVADSLAAVKYLCFDHKICTTRTLYDALMANWEGYEKLREIVINDVPHYGNDNDFVDGFAIWAMHVFCDYINSATGPRGSWRPGTFTMTTNVMYGAKTAATPDGRKSGDPLAEAISPRQGFDKNGPTAYIKSAAKLPHVDIGNGDQLNIKFSKSVIANARGAAQIKHLIQTYFDLGGMQVQFNVVSVDELHEAQAQPDDHKNLIVRIAGFSACFIELPKAVQDDFITRTEHLV